MDSEEQQDSDSLPTGVSDDINNIEQVLEVNDVLLKEITMTEVKPSMVMIHGYKWTDSHFQLGYFMSIQETQWMDS
eukprot:7786418-Ditylum_brightwellii.AAC.1